MGPHLQVGWRNDHNEVAEGVEDGSWAEMRQPAADDGEEEHGPGERHPPIKLGPAALALHTPTQQASMSDPLQPHEPVCRAQLTSAWYFLSSLTSVNAQGILSPTPAAGLPAAAGSGERKARDLAVLASPAAAFTTSSEGRAGRQRSALRAQRWVSPAREV